MRTLPKPTFSYAEVINTCILGTKDIGLEARLRSIEASLGVTASTYDTRGATQSLYLFQQVTSVGAVTKDELEAMYSTHLSATRGSARKYYNAIRSSSAKCPLCGIGTVTVLDHHLPKSKYPDLAICPTNLIPACDFCNNAKKAKSPNTMGEQSLHPYYDDFSQEQWISASLNVVGPPTLEYFVSPPSHWDETSKQRVARHFSVVKLGYNYMTNATDDMVTLRSPLNCMYTNKGPDAVRQYLADEASRYIGRVNSWQHVMYQTLVKNEQFINGGFYEIPV